MILNDTWNLWPFNTYKNHKFRTQLGVLSRYLFRKFSQLVKGLAFWDYWNGFSLKQPSPHSFSLSRDRVTEFVGPSFICHMCSCIFLEWTNSHFNVWIWLNMMCSCHPQKSTETYWDTDEQITSLIVFWIHLSNWFPSSFVTLYTDIIQYQIPSPTYISHWFCSSAKRPWSVCQEKSLPFWYWRQVWVNFIVTLGKFSAVLWFRIRESFLPAGALKQLAGPENAAWLINHMINFPEAVSS